MFKTQRINGFAILIGTLVDLCGSVAPVMAFGFIQGFRMASQGVPEAERQARLTALFQNPVMLLGGLVLGAAFSFLGGFVAARIAKNAEIMHSGVVGGIGTVLGLLFLASPESGPLWAEVAGILLTIPVAILGGHVAGGRRKGAVV